MMKTNVKQKKIKVKKHTGWGYAFKIIAEIFKKDWTSA